MNNKITAKVIADSKSPQGERLTTIHCVCDSDTLKILLTHKELSISYIDIGTIETEDLIKSVQDNPFIPIAWQKDHKETQGSEYFTEECMIGNENKPVKISKRKSLSYSAANQFKPLLQSWHTSRVNAIKTATQLHNMGVAKQLCNRLLEPFMWHTVLISFTEIENFFNLRCPVYEVDLDNLDSLK